MCVCEWQWDWQTFLVVSSGKFSRSIVFRYCRSLVGWSNIDQLIHLLLKYPFGDKFPPLHSTKILKSNHKSHLNDLFIKKKIIRRIHMFTTHSRRITNKINLAISMQSVYANPIYFIFGKKMLMSAQSIHKYKFNRTWNFNSRFIFQWQITQIFIKQIKNRINNISIIIISISIIKTAHPP